VLSCRRAAVETGQVTGTQDKDYNLLWFTQQCLRNALRLETYVQAAERSGDGEVTDLFRMHNPTAGRAPSWARSYCEPGWPADPRAAVARLTAMTPGISGRLPRPAVLAGGGGGSPMPRAQVKDQFIAALRNH
jgi:hypothetical protein